MPSPRTLQHAAIDDRRAPDRANATIDLGQHLFQHFAQRSRLAHVAHALRQVVAKQEQVLLELLFRPALDALLDRVDHDRRERGREDDRALAVGVARVIVDDLLQAIAGAAKIAATPRVISGEVRRTADDDLGIVEPEAEQRDQQA